MSSSRNILFPIALLATLALSACGFQPLHGGKGKQSATVPEMSHIKIAMIADRSGQLVRNALLDRLTPLGQPEKPAYILNVRLSESKQSLGILKDETASRANFILSAGFALTNKEGGTLYSSTSSSQASYNILTEHYASTASEKNARDRTAEDVADAIAMQLAAYFSRARVAKEQAK
ncbi:conserved exported hypothetical protein [Rhodospirillaceae bacterium LM-1]|nr:conserved exported hypothetical protein [Rhodospirillaceae bacterium LM-1]